MKRALMIFAKAPVPGYAKTRLIPRLGEQGAADLQQTLCTRTIEKCLSPDEWQTILWCAPEPSHPFFQHISSTYHLPLKKQIPGNLGHKMGQAFEQTLSEYDQVVIVGTDCAVMDAARVRQAFAALSAGFAVVANPAEDGGYVLLGMDRLIPGIFLDIDWGSERVWIQTKKRLNDLAVKHSELESLWDIDDVAGLERYQALAMV